MTNAPASPVCYGAEADDVYMGYKSRDEILVSLNELLEAERAAANVALTSATSAVDATCLALMRQMGAEEAKWCTMLSTQIERLGGVPSCKTGAFQEKALMKVDPMERLAFLYRGQGWILRKLEALLPRVREGDLHRNLREMLDSHRMNIARIKDELAPSNRKA